jgi:hypothetical protein
MALALLKLPLSVLALLVVGLPVLLAVVVLLLVRSRVPHPRLQPHHDGAGYIYSGLAVLYAVLLAFVVIIVWEQFNTTDEQYLLPLPPGFVDPCVLSPVGEGHTGSVRGLRHPHANLLHPKEEGD